MPHPFARPLAAAAAAAILALLPALAQAQPAPQSSSIGGVTVKVTPRTVAAEAQSWVFGVVLDTHSQELSDDLVRSTVLVTDDGRELQPTAWTGAPAGGHHREGTLEFAAPTPAPASFELRMRRSGEAGPRTFRFAP